MSIEQAQDLQADDEMPPEAVEAGIPLGAWQLAQRYANNGFKSVDEVLREKVPRDVFNRYKELLAEHSASEAGSEITADTEQDATQASGPRTLPPIAAEYLEKLRGQAQPPIEKSDDKTA